MRNLAKINTLQIYYETKITDNTAKNKDRLTTGIICGLKLALFHFGYSCDQLNDMEYVYNELIRLKK